MTPLHVAALNGLLAATKLPVCRGADVHAVDKDGFTPLVNAQHRLDDCPCQAEDTATEWGAVIAFLEKVTPMPLEERMRVARATVIMRRACVTCGAQNKCAATGTRRRDP